MGKQKVVKLKMFAKWWSSCLSLGTLAWQQSLKANCMAGQLFKLDYFILKGMKLFFLRNVVCMESLGVFCDLVFSYV